MHRSMKELRVPLAFFILFVVAAFFREDLLREFSVQTLVQTRRVLIWSLQIGLWLSTGYLVNRLVNVFIWDRLIFRSIGGPVPKLLKDIVALFIFAIAVTGILCFSFGKSISGVMASFTAFGVVIVFALRNVILDIFFGMAVSFDRAYRIGDWVILHDRTTSKDSIAGRVTEINWRATRLEVDGKMVMIPNSIMGSRIITNLMHPEESSEFEQVFTIDFSVPQDRVLRVLTAAIKSVVGEGGLLGCPGPRVRIREINSLGVVYKAKYNIIPRLISPSKARHLVLKSVLEHLRLAGITLAYDKQDIYHRPMPDRQLDSCSITDQAKLLANIPLFKTLPADILANLAQAMNQRLFRDGDEIIKKDDLGDSMFVLVEGLLYVRTDRLPEPCEKAGDESRLPEPPDEEQFCSAGLLVGSIRPGEFFGEMSLLTGEPRSATVTAATDGVVYEITREHVTKVLMKQPGIAETLSRAAAEHRLKTTLAFARLDAVQKDETTKSLADQIMTRMKMFLKGLF